MSQERRIEKRSHVREMPCGWDAADRETGPASHKGRSGALDIFADQQGQLCFVNTVCPAGDDQDGGLTRLSTKDERLCDLGDLAVAWAASCAVRVVEGISFTSQGIPAAENANRTRSIPLLDSIIAAG
jgi:hypothetical protein